MFSQEVLSLARAVIEQSLAQGVTIITAESCTGGLVAGALTAIPGSSAVVEGGFVTYSNAQKHAALGVPLDMLERYGAVSEPVAKAMTEGALTHSSATLALSTTGIAGPGGGTATKPVGLVHMAVRKRDGVTLHRAPVFSGDRDAVREQTVATVLTMALEVLAG